MDVLVQVVAAHILAILILPWRIRATPGETTPSETCVRCEYALAGLSPDANCPECGRATPGVRIIPASERLTWSVEIGGDLVMLLLAWGLVSVILPGATLLAAQTKLIAIGFEPHAVRVFLADWPAIRAIHTLPLAWAVSLGFGAVSQALIRRIAWAACFLAALFFCCSWVVRV